VTRLACRRWSLLTGGGLLGLALNVWAQDGTKPLVILLAAIVGCLLVVGSVGWLTGGQVVKHSRGEAAAITTGRHPMKKELGQ